MMLWGVAPRLLALLRTLATILTPNWLPFSLRNVGIVLLLAVSAHLQLGKLLVAHLREIVRLGCDGANDRGTPGAAASGADAGEFEDLCRAIQPVALMPRVDDDGAAVRS